MSQLDTLITQLGTTDTRKKIQLGNDLISHLNSASKLECEDVGHFIDGLVPWLNSSNYKVSLCCQLTQEKVQVSAIQVLW